MVLYRAVDAIGSALEGNPVLGRYRPISKILVETQEGVLSPPESHIALHVV